MSGGQAQAQAQNYEQNSPQAIALNEARVFSQQLQQQQQQQIQSHQQIDQSDVSRRTSWTGIGPRSVIGSIMNARVSTAASTVGGTSPILGGGGGSVNGDEPTEQTLLLVRPVWVQDQDAAACRICTRTFSAVRRKSGVNNVHAAITVVNGGLTSTSLMSGQVFCHDCCSRSIALPQLGYPKAVRVCNDCFEVAYLVAYCVSDDLGPSTQVASVLSHGGLDAVIYLCSMVHGYELHSLATTALAALSEHKAIQSMIVAKRAMPKLFYIVWSYTNNTPPSVRPPSPPVVLARMASTTSVHTKNVRRTETIAAVLMNVTHIVFQMVPDRMLAKQMVQDGVVDSLMSLCVYFPVGARSRAEEEAIKTMSMRQSELEVGGLDSTEVVSQKGGDDLDYEDEATFSMNDELHSRLENMQSIAAKCISILASDVSNQAYIVDDPERINRLVQLLYSTNLDVVKYASKTMAYLSLRNDKYKPDIAKGSGAAALLAVIRAAGGDQMLSGNSVLAEAVSHACCALANLATNTESQEILMSHMDLLSATCSVVGLFPYQRDIERHVARLIANLALYDQNKLALLTAYNASSEGGIYDRSSSPYPSQYSYHSAAQNRYSSPPPQARRAKSNVIPTLLHIGSLTLEKAGFVGDQGASETYPPLEQDVIDFMNDDGQATTHHNSGYLTPDNSISGTDLSPRSSVEECTGLTHEDEISEWATVPGMEDVQRHIIRAIDNLVTSVAEDPTSNQSFKVFSRIWPTLGLIKTIQMTSHDEDTQRRATHVLSTLISQQEIHADAIAALRQREKALHPVQDSINQTKSGIDALTAMDNQAKEHEERERNERLENENLEKERLGTERLENERLEAEKLERENEEKERKRLEQERLEQERIEQERLEQERLEQERAEHERIEQDRLEQERLEQERLEQERLEKERLEQERLKQERLKQERLKQERLKQERVEEEERIAREHAERKRLEQERLEEEKIKQLNAQRESEEEGPDSEDATGTPSRTASSSEDHITSQDDEQKPKEKPKKKKNKKKTAK
ncbi:hypothetical protein BGX21_007730 [Mortierella sp. AD011]|nr:hypothetical protein BGX21_007730 [Mortierella sp. AD011]